MSGCDHKFIDSKSCLKCGWTPPQFYSEALRVLHVAAQLPPDEALDSIGKILEKAVGDTLALLAEPNELMCGATAYEQVADVIERTASEHAAPSHHAQEAARRFGGSLARGLREHAAGMRRKRAGLMAKLGLTDA